jgi:hypothetical protein
MAESRVVLPYNLTPNPSPKERGTRMADSNVLKFAWAVRANPWVDEREVSN